MTYRKEREALGLSQAEVASRAGVSVSTLRKWEVDPERVSAEFASKCQAALEAVMTQKSKGKGEEGSARTESARFAEVWTSKVLTPRQALAIIVSFDEWAQVDIEGWFEQGCREPLHEVGPFAYFDRRTMMMIGDNKAFAAMAQKRCLAICDELENGVLPFERAGCYFDEVVMGAVLPKAKDMLGDAPEALAAVAGHPQDGDWDYVSDAFDDLAQWDDWETPVLVGHPLLPLILEIRHPFRWFDVGGPRPTMRETVLKHLGMTDKELAEATGARSAP